MSTAGKMSVAALVGVLAWLAFGGFAGAWQDAPTKTWGCVIRFTATGPEIHRNASHTCSLATDVHVDSSGRVVVTGVPSMPIEAVQVTPDESMLPRGVLAGPSGGTGIVRLTVTIRFERVSGWDRRLRCDYCNLWVSGTYTG